MLIDRAGIWYYRIRHQGREYVRTTGLTATKRNVNAANRQEVEARKRLLQGTFDEEPVVTEIFTRAAVEYTDWKDGECRKHPRTAKGARSNINAFLRFFDKDTTVAGINEGMLEDFKTWRRKRGIEEVTIRHNLHGLSDFFHYAKKKNWCVRNPVDDVEIPSDADSISEYVMPEEIQEKFRKIAREISVDYADVAELMLEQGPRPDEVFRLSVFDYLQKEGKFKVSGKSRASRRTLKATSNSKEILERRYKAAKASGSSWLFPSARSKSGHITSLQKQHEAVCAEMGIEFRLYDLRHTFATELGNARESAGTIAHVLGHGSLRTVLRYVHLTESTSDSVIEKAEARRKAKKKISLRDKA